MSEKFAKKMELIREKRNRMLLASVAALIACIISIASIANDYGAILSSVASERKSATPAAHAAVAVTRADAFDVRAAKSEASDTVEAYTATDTRIDTDAFTARIFEAESVPSPQTQDEEILEETEFESTKPEPIVEYVERTEDEIIEYERVTQKSDEHFTDYMKRIQDGVNGRRELVYTDKYIDGELVESELESDTVVEEPIDEITVVGTQEPVMLAGGLDTISSLVPPENFRLSKLTGAPIGYKYVVKGTATAYTGDTHTATGKECRTGYIAVDPNQFPYGTKLWIVSADGEYVYGYCSAEDTGGFAKKKSCTVDLYMDSVSECREWGNRGVIIYVL